MKWQEHAEKAAREDGLLLEEQARAAYELANPRGVPWPRVSINVRVTWRLNVLREWAARRV